MFGRQDWIELVFKIILDFTTLNIVLSFVWWMSDRIIIVLSYVWHFTGLNNKNNNN